MWIDLNGAVRDDYFVCLCSLPHAELSRSDCMTLCFSDKEDKEKKDSVPSFRFLIRLITLSDVRCSHLFKII